MEERCVPFADLRHALEHAESCRLQPNARWYLEFGGRIDRRREPGVCMDLLQLRKSLGGHPDIQLGRAERIGN